MQETLLILIDYVCKILEEGVGPILVDWYIQIKQTQMLCYFC